MQLFGIKFDRRDFWALTLPFVFGLLSWAAWLAEIVYGIGWKSLDWLWEELASVYFVTALAVMSYLSPILLFSRQTPWTTILLCFSGMYISSLAGFFGAKNVFFTLYSKIPPSEHIGLVWSLFFITLGVAAAFFYLKQIYLFKSHSLHVLTLMFVFLSVIPASIITVDWLPGLGNASSFVDAVKMGYPVFWINVLLGQTTYAMVRRWI